jgi:hypothetical protein
MSRLERETLALLESINTRFVCTHCQNSGGEGRHRENCEFFRVLAAWRDRDFITK